MKTFKQFVMENEEHIYDRIQKWLSSGPNKVVQVRTMTRATEYKPKHKDYFFKPKKDGDSGVYVQNGNKKVYVFPDLIHFGEYK